MRSAPSPPPAQHGAAAICDSRHAFRDAILRVAMFRAPRLPPVIAAATTMPILLVC